MSRYERVACVALVMAAALCAIAGVWKYLERGNPISGLRGVPWP